MTKGRKSIVLLLLVLIGLSGCFEFRIPDINQPLVPPTIGVGPYEFFVTSQNWNFNDLAELTSIDSLLDQYRETYPGDPTNESDWFVYRMDMSENVPLPDMDLSVDAVSSSFTQSMIMVSIADLNISLSDPIEMQDLLDLSTVPDGTVLPVDSIEIDPDTTYMEFPMTRQRLSAGTLEITIDNDMHCNLGVPITMTFFDSLTAAPITYAGGDTLQLVWDSPVAALVGEETESASLVGLEFPKTIMIVTTGYAAATPAGTEMITVSPSMRTSSFNVTGSVSNLEADLVEGDVDGQTLNTNDVISFGDAINEPGLSVDKVYLGPSHVKITITNSSPITGKLLLELASLDTSLNAGIQAFNTDSLNIPAEGTQSYTFPLNNASVDLSSDFAYASYVKTPGQYAEIESSDEFEIEFEFYGATPGEAIAIESVDATFTDAAFEFDNMAIEGFNLNEVLPEFLQGIELASVLIDLDIITSLTIPLTLDLELIGVKNGGADSSVISISQQISGSGGDPHIEIHNAAALINFMPDSVFFGGEASLNGSGNLALSGQDIDVDIEIAVPLQFTLSSPFTYPIPYIPLQQMDPLPEFLDDFSGSILIDIDNTFRFGIDLSVYAAHDTMYFNNPTYVDCVRTIAELNIPAIDSIAQTLTLSKDDYDFLVGAQDSNWLYIEAYMNDAGDGQPVTLVSTDEISLDILIRAEGTIDFQELVPDTTGGAQ